LAPTSTEFLASVTCTRLLAIGLLQPSAFLHDHYNGACPVASASWPGAGSDVGRSRHALRLDSQAQVRRLLAPRRDRTVPLIVGAQMAAPRLRSCRRRQAMLAGWMHGAIILLEVPRKPAVRVAPASTLCIFLYRAGVGVEPSVGHQPVGAAAAG
jgi:hypothetical protein